MLRSKWFGVVRNCYEAVESAAFARGWAARLAYDLGLQGAVRTSTHHVLVERGPPLPRPLRIAFASDFHAGPLTDVRLLREVFRLVRELAPDVVLLGGDFVGLHARHVAKLRDVVATVAPPLGVVAVLGNHDLWKGAATIRSALESVGVRVLQNAAVRLARPFDQVVVVGLDDPCIGRPDAHAAFGHEPDAAVRVALIHSPEGVDLLRDRDVAVALAGHTHGGQICLPDGRALLVPPGCWRWKKGRFDVPGIPGGMVVSRGVGCSTLPVRIACPSEVVLCVLANGERR